MAEFRRYAMPVCPECSQREGHLIPLQVADNYESATCRYCETTYRSRHMVLYDADIVAILFNALSQVAPDAVGDAMRDRLEAGLQLRLKQEREKEANDD